MKLTPTCSATKSSKTLEILTGLIIIILSSNQINKALIRPRGSDCPDVHIDYHLFWSHTAKTGFLRTWLN